MFKLKSDLLLGVAFALALLGYFQWKGYQANPLSTASNLSDDLGSKSGGLNPKNQIVFAGLSGVPPRFIDFGPSQGKGWVEYHVHEVKRGMRADGFEFKQEWMTPARIEHEFRVGNPICIYPYEWNNPARTFSEKPDRIYSIALDFEEEASRSIILNRGDFSRFQKYVDPKGDLKIDQLLEDQSFKMVLVRNKNYGRLNEKLTETDGLGEQKVREPYRKHVELMMIRDNRQLIEMLNAHRFDYIFSDSIEDQDLAFAKLDKERFIQIGYETSHIKNIQDPNLNISSVACSIHPKTLEAMPYFNKWIALLRGPTWKYDKLLYRNRVDPKFAGVRILAANYLVSGRFLSQLADGTADEWYRLQQAYFPSLKLYPETPERLELPRVEQSKKTALQWHLVFESPKSAVVLNESQFYHRSLLDADNMGRDETGINPNWPWSHTMLYRSLSEALAHRLLHFDFDKEPPGVPQLGDLDLRSGLERLTLFASGLSPQSIRPLFPVIESEALRSLTVFDASPETASQLVAHLPKGLVSLNLTQSSLHTAQLADRIKQLPGLRHLCLNSTQLRQSELERLLIALPNQVESLSLGWLISSWNNKSAEIFGARHWPNLEHVDLRVNAFDDRQWELLRQGLPEGLQTLELGGNFMSPRGLNSLSKFSKLKAIDLGLLDFYSQSRPFSFPDNLERLSAWYTPLDFRFLTLPRSFSVLDLPMSADLAPNEGLSTVLSHLGPDLSMLNLMMSKVDTAFIRALVEKRHIRHIERLDLSHNNLDDQAIELLSQANFSVSHLNLDSNSIGDKGAEIISKRWLNQLKSLNLSANPISARGISALAGRLPAKLERLELAGVFELDVKALAAHLPSGLKKLNLARNQLSDRDLEILAPFIPNGLYDLNLAGSAFGVKGSWHLAHGMPKRLAMLDLNRVPLRSQGVEILAPHLPKTLVEVFLGGVALEPSAVSLLAKALPPNLRFLQLEGIRWDLASARTLLGALPGSLQRLRLNGVPVFPGGARSLSEHWPTNIRFLQILGGELGDEGAQALSERLPFALERLELDHTGIGDTGLRAMSDQPLEHLSTWISRNNSFGPAGIKAFSSKKRNLNHVQFTSCRLDSTAILEMGPGLLERAHSVLVGNNSFSNQAILKLIPKLNPEVSDFFIPSVGLTYAGVDALIESLPKNIRRHVIAGNDLGERGFKKFEELAKERQKIGPRMFLFK